MNENTKIAVEALAKRVKENGDTITLSPMETEILGAVVEGESLDLEGILREVAKLAEVESVNVVYAKDQ